MPFDGAEFPVTAVSPPPAAPVAPRWLARLLERARSTQPFRRDAEGDVAVALRLLSRARRLIEHRDRWVQGTYQTYYGYCAVGALHAAWRWQSEAGGYEIAYGLLRDIAAMRDFSGIVAMNDESSHGDVVHAFDEAIAAAQARVTAFAQAAHAVEELRPLVMP